MGDPGPIRRGRTGWSPPAPSARPAPAARPRTPNSPPASLRRSPCARAPRGAHWGDTVANSRPCVHGQLRLTVQRRQQCHGEHAPHATVQPGPRPHLAPCRGGDVILPRSGELGRCIRCPIHVCASPRTARRTAIPASNVSPSIAPLASLFEALTVRALTVRPGRNDRNDRTVGEEISQQLGNQIGARHVGQMCGAGH